MSYQAEESNTSSPNSWMRCSSEVSATLLAISQEFVMFCETGQKKVEIFSHQEKEYRNENFLLQIRTKYRNESFLP